MAMSFIETLSTGITLLNFGKELYDLVTGYTVSRKLDKIYSKIETLFLRKERVFLLFNAKGRYFYSLN